MGHKTTFAYDDADHVTQSTDPNGVITHNIYHPYTGDLLETYLTQGQSPTKYSHSRFEYENGQVIRSYRVANNGTEYLVLSTEFDSNGHASSTTDAAGLSHYFGYDSNGNQTHSWYVWHDPDTSDPRPDVTLVTVTTYDAQDRATKTEEFDLVDQAITTFGALLDALESADPLTTTQTSYDGDGRATESIDRFGTHTVTVYDSRGNIVESRTQGQMLSFFPLGWVVTRTLYDDFGRVIFVTDPYFQHDWLATDNAGISTGGTRTVYDSLGRVSATERYEGVTINLADDPNSPFNGHKISQTDFNFDAATPVRTSLKFYDDIGRADHTINESGARTDYYYDAAGRQIAVLGPLTVVGGFTVRNLSQSIFDPGGRMIQALSGIAVGNFDGQHADYSEHPGLEDLLDPDSGLRNDDQLQTTYFEFDPAGRQTAVVTSAIDNPEYTGSEPARIHLRRETVYDDFGRRVASRDGITQEDALDASTIDRTHQRETNYQYDNAGNLTAVILPPVDHPSASIGDVRPRTEHTYDVYGNRLSIRDNVVDQNGQGDYDHDGTAGDDTRVTLFTYDQHNRQVTRQLPLGVAGGGFVETNSYNDTPLANLTTNLRFSVGLGELEYTVDFEGHVTAYQYDNSPQGGGRLNSQRYYNTLADYQNSPSTPADSISYTYDSLGNRMGGSFTHGSTGSTFTQVLQIHDTRGRLTQNIEYDTSTSTTVLYEYDPATDRVIRAYTSPANTDTRYVYDSLGRLSQVVVVKQFNTAVSGATVNWVNASGQTVSITGDVTTYSYDLVGNLSRVKLSNGLVTDYFYDELNRLVKQANYIDSGSVAGQFDDDDLLRASFEYELDVFGNRTHAVEKTNDDPDDNSGTVTTAIDWVYDDLGRLVEEDYDDDTSNHAQASDYEASYAFDLVGNRVQKDVDHLNVAGVDESITSHYDANDRLRYEVATVSGVSKTTFYQYDNSDGDGDVLDGTTQTRKATYSGSLSSEPGSGAQDVVTYSYNLQGRLKQMVAGGVTYDYVYDDFGNRVSQTVNSAKTSYIVDIQNPSGYAQVLEEKDGASPFGAQTQLHAGSGRDRASDQRQHLAFPDVRRSRLNPGVVEFPRRGSPKRRYAPTVRLRRLWKHVAAGGPRRARASFDGSALLRRAN